MFILIYISRANCSFEELSKIVEQAQERNDDRGITGFLMCIGSVIVQVLEGDQQTVEELAEKISSDERHDDMDVIYRCSGLGRNFPVWSMALIPVPRDQIAALLKVENFSDDHEVYRALNRPESAIRVASEVCSSLRLSA